MTEEQIQMLIDIGISEKDIPNCFITEDGKIFTPLKDEEGNLLKTGEELYNEDFLNPQMQQPTEQQILNAKLLQDNATMQLELEQQIQLNAQILLQIAGGVIND